MSGNNACGCAVVSIKKTIEVSIALEAPANIAAIPIIAAVARLIPLPGNICNTSVPSKAPAAPPIVNKGASVPPEVPLPAIAEVQNALFNATTTITGEDEDSVKRRLRTGTVVTTDDRNWELRYAASALRFNQSRAVAIDMESATVAAQGYRFRVPYGTLLCVSDKPLHGELKLPGQANAFYERAVSQHLRIGIEALNLLQREGEGLHSRKLRSFDEPPLR